jgi:hypothetical protein
MGLREDNRYYGTYDLIRRIEMKTVYDRNNGTGERLPCDFAGWVDILPYDRIGRSANEVFNCSCNSGRDQIFEQCNLSGFEPISIPEERFLEIRNEANVMKIEVEGTSCAKCKNLLKHVEEAV